MPITSPASGGAFFSRSPVFVFVFMLLLAFAATPSCLRAAAEYSLGPESTSRLPGVPKGRVEKFQFDRSKIYPDTTRDCWVYIPAQYDGTRAAALMVFQ